MIPTFEIASSEKLLEHTRQNIIADKLIFPSGKEYEYVYRTTGGKRVVFVVPIMSDDQVVLVRQYRHPLRRDVLEIPAGIVEEGESFEEGALRELREETGYTATHAELIGKLAANPAASDLVVRFYLARNVTKVGEPLNTEIEHTTPVLMPISKISQALSDGKIESMFTAAGFMLAMPSITGTSQLWQSTEMADQLDYESTSNYTIKAIEGWNAYVNNRLLDEKKEIGDKIWALMQVKLFDINRTVPEPALEKLREVPIWLEAESKKVICACYHPSKKWLSENGFNTEKARSVEIGNPDNFLSWTLDQPSMVLHELAHAYHHRVLGYDNPDIKSAYDRAVESKSYESVLRNNGQNARAYALNNDQEYFAELTEAYFGTNDFYPFVRAEIMPHDPQMYETLKKLWKV